MTTFTPGLALAGGALVGGSVALLWLGNGRIAGISGIFDAATTFSRKELGWQVAFVFGLLTPSIVTLIVGIAPSIEMGSFGWLAISGFLVGIGTRMGSGCTSGHGVCGMARGSPRSIAATLTFIAVAVVVVFLTHHVFGGAHS